MNAGGVAVQGVVVSGCASGVLEVFIFSYCSLCCPDEYCSKIVVDIRHTLKRGQRSNYCSILFWVFAGISTRTLNLPSNNL